MKMKKRQRITLRVVSKSLKERIDELLMRLKPEDAKALNQLLGRSGSDAVSL